MVTVEDGPGVTPEFRRQMENGVRGLSGDFIVRLKRLVLTLLCQHSLLNAVFPLLVNANTVMWTCRTHHKRYDRCEHELFQPVQDMFRKVFPEFDVRCALVGYSGAEGSLHHDAARGIRVVIPLLHLLLGFRKITFSLGSKEGRELPACRRCFTLGAQDAYVATSSSRGAVEGPKLVDTTIRHQATNLTKGDFIFLLDPVPTKPLDEEAYLVSGAVETALRRAASFEYSAPPGVDWRRLVVALSKYFGRQAVLQFEHLEDLRDDLRSAWGWAFFKVSEEVLNREREQQSTRLEKEREREAQRQEKEREREVQQREREVQRQEKEREREVQRQEKEREREVQQQEREVQRHQRHQATAREREQQWLEKEREREQQRQEKEREREQQRQEKERERDLEHERILRRLREQARVLEEQRELQRKRRLQMVAEGWWLDGRRWKRRASEDGI